MPSYLGLSGHSKTDSETELKNCALMLMRTVLPNIHIYITHVHICVHDDPDVLPSLTHQGREPQMLSEVNPPPDIHLLSENDKCTINDTIYKQTSLT